MQQRRQHCRHTEPKCRSRVEERCEAVSWLSSVARQASLVQKRLPSHAASTQSKSCVRLESAAKVLVHWNRAVRCASGEWRARDRRRHRGHTLGTDPERRRMQFFCHARCSLISRAAAGVENRQLRWSERRRRHVGKRRCSPPSPRSAHGRRAESRRPDPRLTVLRVASRRAEPCGSLRAGRWPWSCPHANGRWLAGRCGIVKKHLAPGARLATGAGLARGDRSRSRSWTRLFEC